MPSKLREDILWNCFTRHTDEPIEFAGGEQANNKLDLEKINQRLRLRAKTAVRMAEMVRQSEFYPKLDLLVAVPNGANWLASDMGFLLGRAALLLDKDSDTKEFSLKPNGEAQLARAESVVIIDDVLNKLTNTSKVYELPGMAERVVAVFSIWDRNPDRTLVLPVPTQSIINEEIPAWLSDDSNLWKFTE